MATLNKKITFIVSIIAIVLISLSVLGVCLLKKILNPQHIPIPEPYNIPTEFITNFTVEEHKQRIYIRATEVAESIEYDGKILYDIVYDSQDQPRYFIVEFEEVVEIYVGKGKQSLDQYICTRVILGAIINDEYYIMNYGLGYDLTGSKPSSSDEWLNKQEILSTPPSIYTLLDVWDCKKYLYNLYQDGETIYRGEYVLLDYELLHTTSNGVDYYAKKYQAVKEKWDKKNSFEPIGFKLQTNWVFNYNHATSLEQAYIFKMYEK